MYQNKFETDLHQYAQLRTILDSLDIGALRYYLDAASLEEQKKNFECLEAELMPIIKRIWARTPDTEGCPDGYMECYGVCVPYNCAF